MITIDQRLERLKRTPRYGSRSIKDKGSRVGKKTLLAVDFFSPELSQAKNVLHHALTRRSGVNPTRLKAAIEVFDRVFGKPTQGIAVETPSGEDAAQRLGDQYDLSKLSTVELASLYREALAEDASGGTKSPRAGNRK